MPEAHSEIAFQLWEYTGPGGLIVHGFTTGNFYRFAWTGARVAVDPRDGAWWCAMPFLRRCL